MKKDFTIQLFTSCRINTESIVSGLSGTLSVYIPRIQACSLRTYLLCDSPVSSPW